MIKPPGLKKGDSIYICTPAKAIDKELVLVAKKQIEDRGYKVIISKNCFGKNNYFSGSDEERIADFQFGIDHEEVKAIFCARGGYGSVRILDSLNWANMLREPKWLVGYSDITVFHQRLNKLGIQSIHGTMPFNFGSNSIQALTSLFSALENTNYTVSAKLNESNCPGKANGMLIGGNLSIVYSLLGTNDSYLFEDKILFIEDISEHYYQLDRILFTLKKAGVFEAIKGLIVGGMTDIQDTEVPFGMSIEEIVLQHFTFRKIPIGFDFPVGHISDNQALIVGANVQLTVDEKGSQLSYIN